MKTKSLITALAMLLPSAPALHAETAAEKEARMKWFNEARFGMFIHWGVYSGAAGNFKGKPVPGAGEWLQSGGKIPAAEYREELLPKFNPVKYDPDAWVLAAKNAGMKYLVITSKHHDGFCLWDSKLTDWDVASTPYKKDLLKPLEEACRKHGIRFCVYHSIMDWSHPDWGSKEQWKKPAPWMGNASNPNPDMDRFTSYLKGQLDELITSYHPGILWFDGEWEPAWTHERGVDLYNWLRAKDPALIINNRVDKGRKGMEGHTKDPMFKGDYGTPEQQIPATGFGEGVSWESCMTMNGTWGFKENDTKWKSAETLVQNLIDIASKGGNYLLNVGPTGEGEIPAASLERLAAIGEWMKMNGESIHGTTASLFSKPSWKGRSTTRQLPSGGARIYVHVFGKPEGGVIAIDQLVTRPAKVFVLGHEGSPEITGGEAAWNIRLPEGSLNPIATVLALDFASTPEIQATVKP
jgi:alpha-L-fucosidase